MKKLSEWLQSQRSYHEASIEIGDLDSLPEAYGRGARDAYIQVQDYLRNGRRPIVPNAVGVYVGDDINFKGQKALLNIAGHGVAFAQFNDGPLWMTHSWLTTAEEDWDWEEIDLTEGCEAGGICSNGEACDLSGRCRD